jgi:sugar phosphate isomerase/epimerase
MFEAILKHHSTYGIVQGRLSVPPDGQLQWFPVDIWPNEFYSAKLIGLNYIELLAERNYNSDNPIWSYTGRNLLLEHAASTGLSMYSSCIDYVIENSLVNDLNSDTFNHVKRFIEASSCLGCKIVIIPLLENSDLNTSTLSYLLPIIRSIASIAADFDIVVAIESLLDAKSLSNFLDLVKMDNVKCVFDTGNRVLLSNSLSDDVIALGDKIAHVHIKDKDSFGNNVLLGTGNVNFISIFRSLRDIEYRGSYVFETTRGTRPLDTAYFHLQFCNFCQFESSNV